MADQIPELPPGFKMDPVPELPPGFKLDPVGQEKPKTPQETKQFLQGRYGDILKRNSDPSGLGVTKEVLKGAGKTVASDLESMLGPLSSGYALAKGLGAPGIPEPQGEGQEAGGMLVRGAEAIPVATGVYRLATQTVSRLLSQPGGVKKVREFIQFAKHPLKTAAIRALEQILPEEAAAIKRPGLKPPKYGGPTAAFDEGASRLQPRKPATLPQEEPFQPGKGLKPPKYGGPVEEFDQGARRLTPRKPAPLPEPEVEKFEPFKPSSRTAAKLRSGGSPEPFDEGASRLPAKRRLEPKVEPKTKPKLKEKVAAAPDTPVKPTPVSGKSGNGLDTGSEPSVTSIKHEARHTDAMRAVFANARNLGVDSKALRAAAKEFYGKGISEMTYEEVVDLNERLLLQKAVPKK